MIIAEAVQRGAGEGLHLAAETSYYNPFASHLVRVRWKLFQVSRCKSKMLYSICFQDINVCILENYPECSNPRVFYIIPYFCGQHPQCRYLTLEFLARVIWHCQHETTVTLTLLGCLTHFVCSPHQGAGSVGSGKGQTKCDGELPPGWCPGGAGGCSPPVREALTSLFHRGAQHL